MANNIVIDRRLLLLSASAFTLAGCGGLGLGPTDANQTIYVLQPALTTPPSGGTPVPWALAIDIPGASDSIDTRRIALIKSDATMDYYANAQWPDRLPLLVQTALVAAFEASGRVPSVSRTQDALHADYELGVEIRDCSAHYASSDDKGNPGGLPSMTVTLIAVMSTAHGRLITANYSTSQTAAASQNSTGAAVQALNTALGTAVEQIVAWALTLPKPASP